MIAVRLWSGVSVEGDHPSGVAQERTKDLDKNVLAELSKQSN